MPPGTELVYAAPAKETGCDMTDKSSPDSPALARFLQDWAALWREEVQALTSEAAGQTPDPAEAWRAAVRLWADALLVPPSALVPRHDAHATAATTGATAAPAAPDARDGAIERLTRRIDELEARLARLEPRPDAAPAGKGRRARS